jgi:general secretion pathway protein F
MARFAYLAVDRDGRERSGALTAESEAAARAQLEKKHWMPVRLVMENAARSAHRHRSAAAAETTAGPVPRGARLSFGDQVLFARQFATLIEASTPVDEALGLIADQQEKPAARAIIADVQEGVIEGQRLADAMGRHPRSFSPLFRAAIAGGERAGALAPVLARLAVYLARAQALRSKLTTALVYPAALVIVAVVVIACLMIFVVPSLTQQFATFETDLPPITQILIVASTFLAQFWLLLLIGVMAFFFIARALLAKPAMAMARDRMVLGLPLIGRWSKVVNASRFARAASTLTSSGLPVLDSVRAARASVGNRYVSAMIARMADRIEEGEPLSQAMRAAGVFPPLVASMAASGESAGSLPLMLEKAADYLDQDFDAFSTRAISLFEPAVILVMGGLVATIVLSIMLPILQLNQLAIR